jgi:UDP-N-acetylmuramoyl-L-alanyl-D-glutamate--2,6-diaminopimelate ligase
MMTALRHDSTGMDLQTLFAGFVDLARVPQLSVSGLSLNSRLLQPGELFLACAGTAQHGARFIEDAIARGAIAIAVEPGEETRGVDLAGFSVPLFEVEALHSLASAIAARFYGDPSERMQVIGITGTNGKTSVSQFIAQAISRDTPCGVVGTLGSGLYGQLSDTGHTTPDAVSLQRQLSGMVDSGAAHLAMEVSSHALDQGRVNGIHFDVAVFTNLSHEHLDYHGDMANYADAKRRLLNFAGVTKAVINADDPVGRNWLATLPEGVEAISYALSSEAALRGDGLQLDGDGQRMSVSYAGQSGELKTGLLGRFNAANLLAAMGALLALGYEFNEALTRLAQASTVPGRMEAFGGGNKPLVVVDYAHTPDALENALSALREHTTGRLWCIFGCGGDRDREKRPLMGRIAEQLADSVVVTDDNPRREEPYSIIEAILSGIMEPDAVYICRDRSKAIAHAISMSRKGDVILVAGKGHESEQKIGDQLIPYSDRVEVAGLLGEEVRNG